MGKHVRKLVKAVFSCVLPIILTIAISVVAISIILYTPQSYTIIDFGWERNIFLEINKTVRESDWTLPENAVLDHTRKEIFGYTKILDHYETRTRLILKEPYSYDVDVKLEELTIEEIEKYYDIEYYNNAVYHEEPVYATKYYYAIDKWVYSRTLTTTGNDKNPYWESVVLNLNEQINNTTENYWVWCKNTNGNMRRLFLSYNEWSSLELGQVVKVINNVIIN